LRGTRGRSPKTLRSRLAIAHPCLRTCDCAKVMPWVRVRSSPRGKPRRGLALASPSKLWGVDSTSAPAAGQLLRIGLPPIVLLAPSKIRPPVGRRCRGSAQVFHAFVQVRSRARGKISGKSFGFGGGSRRDVQLLASLQRPSAAEVHTRLLSATDACRWTVNPADSGRERGKTAVVEVGLGDRPLREHRSAPRLSSSRGQTANALHAPSGRDRVQPTRAHTRWPRVPHLWGPSFTVGPVPRGRTYKGLGSGRRQSEIRRVRPTKNRVRGDRSPTAVQQGAPSSGPSVWRPFAKRDLRRANASTR